MPHQEVFEDVELSSGLKSDIESHAEKHLNDTSSNPSEIPPSRSPVDETHPSEFTYFIIHSHLRQTC
jgi:hypothetical protein